MCGIIGVAGKITAEVRDKVFKDMLDVCQVRGRDSTGVIKVNKDLEYSWVKKLGPPANLFEYRAYETTVERGDTAVLVGHCRSKTSGSLDVKSAHPFDIEDKGIIGVHNGTLRQYYDLDGYDCQKVDSEVLYGHLANSGAKKTFERLKGSFACVWWDNNEKILNFIRNNERPLWFTWSKDKSMMFWASEDWMFSVISRKVELWEGENNRGKNKYIQLPENTLWQFKVDWSANVAEKQKHLTMRPSRKIEPIKEEEVRRYTGNYGMQGGYTGNGQGKTIGHGKEKSPYGDGWERVNGVWQPKDKVKGGEVANPFSLLDDELPEALQGGPKDTTGSQEELKSSQLGNVHFMNISLRKKGLETEQKQSQKSGRKTDFSQRPILSIPQSNNNVKPFEKLKRLLGVTASNSSVIPISRDPVSLRTVAGINYITNGKTGVEYTENEFEENTLAQCSFCMNPIGGLEEVAEFIDEHDFICKGCLNPPEQLVNYGV
jgi:hypothetical protein